MERESFISDIMEAGFQQVCNCGPICGGLWRKKATSVPKFRAWVRGSCHLRKWAWWKRRESHLQWVGIKISERLHKGSQEKVDQSSDTKLKPRRGNLKQEKKNQHLDNCTMRVIRISKTRLRREGGREGRESRSSGEMQKEMQLEEDVEGCHGWGGAWCGQQRHGASGSMAR